MTPTSPAVPTSLAVVPPQPSVAVYGPDDLQLFVSYTRATYLTAFGVDAPTYNPTPDPAKNFTARSKSWWDSGAASKADAFGNVTYSALAAMQPNPATPVYESLVMTLAEAMAVNIPGIHSYPPYVIQPTQTTSGGSVINPVYLSTSDQANAIMAAVSGTSLSMESYSYPTNEPRRVYNFLFKGQLVNVGQCVQLMNAEGVGAPGTWNLMGAFPAWVTAVPSVLPMPNPSWDIPQRPLLPNEIIVPAQLPPNWNIARTDMQSAATQSAGGGGLSSAQATQLAQMSTDITAMRQKLGQIYNF